MCCCGLVVAVVTAAEESLTHSSCMHNSVGHRLMEVEAVVSESGGGIAKVFNTGI